MCLAVQRVAGYVQYDMPSEKTPAVEDRQILESGCKNEIWRIRLAISYLN